jgi:hypothetical protein
MFRPGGSRRIEDTAFNGKELAWATRRRDRIGAIGMQDLRSHRCGG